MTSTLIIVEGTTDKGFIEGIAEKLQTRCKVHPMRGNRPDKAKRLLKAFAGIFEKAIILKDLHRGERRATKLISEIEKEIQQLENQLPCQVIPVKRSIESWILAGLCIKNPEDIPDPEEELKRLMQKKSKHFIKSPEVYKRLAKDEVDIQKASTKSETFKNFIKLLTIK